MCGITGFLNAAPQTGSPEFPIIVSRMTDTLRHRGPDDTGIWWDAGAGIAFGHRRLSIIDLSPTGHQPMQSTCGRYVITLNGEIYNFKILRNELESLGHTFRGHSDTEVFLASIRQWGFESALSHVNGMFACAVWDGNERRLYLGRDRLGEKPLYYGWQGTTFLFGSELKALRAHRNFRAGINRDALALYLRFNTIPAPYTIYNGIYKLPPGTFLTITASDYKSLPLPVAYWTVRAAAERGVADPFKNDPADIVHELDQLLKDAVKLRMVADVGLGVFLSGGVDSSTIVALMQAQSTHPVKSFTIGFHHATYNEAADAKAVAQHLGTDHTELYVTPAEAMEVIPRLPALYDEPFSDSSQIPTFLVCRLARQHVTVSLSGDGGDELFGGYNRYIWDRHLRSTLRNFPRILKKIAKRTTSFASPQTWDAIFHALSPLLPSRLRQRAAGEKLQKLATILTEDSPEAMYLRLISHCHDPAAVVINGREPMSLPRDRGRWAALPDFTHTMMYLDMMTYLPDDILTKVDRASMGVGLEARAPFLDHRVVEFAWRIPLSMKIRKGRGKWLLRQVLYRYVPPALIERPKMGFGVPIDSWLRGPLRDWAETLLEERRLQEEGFFNPQPIRRKWSEHLAGTHNWQYDLWDVLMFQAWIEEHAPVAGACHAPHEA